MKLKIDKLILMVGVLCCTMLLTNCTGDAGDPGPNGKDGEPGVTGSTGKDGDDGANGAGYDEATKNGNIILYLDGNLPNGEAFKDTINFNYSTADLSYSAARKNGVLEVEFDIARHNVVGEAMILLQYDLNFESPGDTTITFNAILAGIKVSTSPSYFIDETFDNTKVVDNEFTDLVYDQSSGKLNFNFAFTLPAGNNLSNHDLRIRGVANVVVYQEL